MKKKKMNMVIRQRRMRGSIKNCSIDNDDDDNDGDDAERVQ